VSIHWIIKHVENQTKKPCNSVDRNDVTSPSQVAETLEFLQCPVCGNTKIWTQLYGDKICSRVPVKQERPSI